MISTGLVITISMVIGVCMGAFIMALVAAIEDEQEEL